MLRYYLHGTAQWELKLNFRVQWELMCGLTNLRVKLEWARERVFTGNFCHAKPLTVVEVKGREDYNRELIKVIIVALLVTIRPGVVLCLNAPECILPIILEIFLFFIIA